MHMMLNGGYTFDKYSVGLLYKEDDVMLNGASGERSQGLVHSVAWLW